MNKIGIHIFVQSPDVCLSVREVRIMHFVALKNDTPDNFEIAFASSSITALFFFL